MTTNCIFSTLKILDLKEAALRGLTENVLFESDPTTNASTITPYKLRAMAKATIDMLLLYRVFTEHDISYEAIVQQAQHPTWSLAYPRIFFMLAYELSHEHEDITWNFDGNILNIAIEFVTLNPPKAARILSTRLTELNFVTQKKDK